MDAETRARFERRISVEPNTGCWLWTGGLSTSGYGRFFVGGQLRMAQAHRVSYEIHRGPIPEGLELDHLCRTRCCVNPDHLEAVTHHENTKRLDRDALARGRRRTHCPQGHEYAGDNLMGSVGRRRCLTCAREYAKRKYDERRLLSEVQS